MKERRGTAVVFIIGMQLTALEMVSTWAKGMPLSLIFVALSKMERGSAVDQMDQA